MLDKINTSDSKRIKKSEKGSGDVFGETKSFHGNKTQVEETRARWAWGGHIGCVHLFFFHFEAVLRWHIDEKRGALPCGGCDMALREKEKSTHPGG